MPLLKKKVAVATLAIELPACTTTENKYIALNLLTQGVAKFDRDYITRFVASEYRQHNPIVEDGRIGLLQFIDSLESKHSKITIKPIRILAEGELVMIHQQAQVDGEDLVAIDLFKINDSKITEHWDVIQSEITETTNGNSMTGGVAKITDLDKTAENKQLVANLIDDIFINSNRHNLAQYIDPNYVQHSPFVPDGREGLEGFLQGLADSNTSFFYTKMHNILAEGNFVFTQSEGVFDDTATAFNDLWRIEDGKVVEHWDAVQAIPEEFAHGNGMF
ncbi:nuclear transport factor 2 family protein [Vibrio splendidus]|uniref:nuclear transport factor 2 family protein n=1 Tax=Vibrio TaxID=662 RepID=UPI0002F6B737|nr:MULTISPECIES: nuclear transport factor 2 family protein [Vibrio]OEF51768.1 hypothetical protein OAC_15100 [Vibrio cyclitrophicus 1F273]OEF69476.1 hypothetical protein A148_23270 [Vibrio splendidus 1F-157]PMI50414.1 hypothetical protein BCU42_10785 [Vibrio splendidus]PMO90370.1 hypothetical protein BCS97_23005 [Vibrio splendidus]PMP27984.1 hypothetical protein BCS88_21310 [Vibrio splendidus]